jgi:asparagine synthase (glutamine-hydrolysing)
MCGIFFIKHKKLRGDQLKQFALKFSKLQTHRGPNESGAIIIDEHVCLCHERLAIIDLQTGRQPILNETEEIALLHNGEIYNYQEIKDGLKGRHTFKGHSDSETIVHLYEETEDLATLCDKLDGDFAIVIYDSKKKQIFAARDAVGVKPLYYGIEEDGSIFFSSEMKALSAAKVKKFEIFPPGHMFVQKGDEEGVLTQWYNPKWYDPTVYSSESAPLQLIRSTLEKAVEKRLMSDVPLGVFLSGGLDSSLVAALVKKHVKDLHSFSVGVGEESSDIIAARSVAKHIGSIHHEKIFTFEEGLKMIETVIYHLESFDVTSIRASTPMLILSKFVKNFVTVVLSGEGADEAFAGYIYFRDATSPEMLQKELVNKVKFLYTADVNRCDKATMAGSLEARVPFLDKDFLNLIMSINPQEKMYTKDRIEKWILRKAFDGLDLLPHEILWRVKEQFSDGVGYSWIDGLKDHCEKQVSDEEFATAAKKFPYLTPITKEAFFYRTIFTKLFPDESSSKCTKLWCPWSKFNVDPSGRFQRKYELKE